MRVALISDIHSNLPGLEAVLKTIKKHRPERIVSLGDQVNLGPLPRETLALLRTEGVTCLHGNHERYVLSAMDGDPAYRGANFASLRYNAALLCDAGVLDKPENIGRYMWHGGAHHVGYDVHDVIERPLTVKPGMVFCIDVGIYHEEWGIGFRLEDNLLVTEDGCENLSAAIPRTVEDIEAVMRKG